MFLKIRVINCEYIVKVSLNMCMMSLYNAGVSRIPSHKNIKNKSAMHGAQFLPIGIPAVC